MRFLLLTEHDLLTGSLKGKVSIESIISYYSASDIYLLPSEMDGVAMYEAMSMKLAVVAADVDAKRHY